MNDGRVWFLEDKADQPVQRWTQNIRIQDTGHKDTLGKTCTKQRILQGNWESLLTSHDEGDDLQRTCFNVHILKDFSIFHLLSMCTLYFPIYLLVATSYQEKRRRKKKEKAPPPSNLNWKWCWPNINYTSE